MSVARSVGVWLPSPFLKASALFHSLLPLGLIAEPRAWPLGLAAFAANHLIISSAGLVPRGNLLGPNITRLPVSATNRGKVAITIDDGPDPEVTPAVLDILARHGARATFFCIGARAQEHPAIAHRIVAAGHELQNHTGSHPWYFSFFGPWRIRREIESGQRELHAISGARPTLFRAPAGFRNVFLQPELRRAHLLLVSWTRRGFDTACREPDVVCSRLLRNLSAGDILLLHDGSAARTDSGTPVILDVLPRLLQKLDESGLGTVLLSEAIEGAARNVEPR